MVHDKTGPDRKKLDRRNARQQPIKFKDSGFRTGKMLQKKIKLVIVQLVIVQYRARAHPFTLVVFFQATEKRLKKVKLDNKSLILIDVSV